MSTDWTAARRDTLKALCDCTFPSLAVSPDPHGFWARSASAFGIDVAAAALIDQTVPEPQRSGLLGLLDALAANGLASLPREVQEQLLLGVAASSPEAKAGVMALQRIALGLCYTLPDAQGRNPNWPALSYPGPVRAPSPRDKRIKPLVVDADHLTFEADVCIVGSGAGGGVIAGELTARGLSVIVLEAGGYYNEAEFNQLELWAFQNLYWRGGYQPTADQTVQVVAGATLGGGTTVNWQNCVRTPAWVRTQWAREHGLDGLDGDEFEGHLTRVMERIQANDTCSDENGPHARLREGAEALGYNYRRCLRNVDTKTYDAETAGFQGFGDITGSRLSTLNTYLDDAHRAGARILVRTTAQRITTGHGRATGVIATSIGPDGRPHEITVRARHVVSACGALETPALLLRSGIGGKAAGNYLRLHPTVALTGMYAEDQRGWWGPPQSGLCDQLTRLEEDHGILIECAHHSLLVAATATPWQSGQQHKTLMSEGARMAAFIAITRDRGHGRVEIDASGNSVPFYPVRDALDIKHMQRGILELAKLHHAAGASRMLGIANDVLHVWERGEDLERFTRVVAGTPGEPVPQQLFSAHQMGSARMGTDPDTSVAKPSGELHDVRGVWIGDTSAFPTAPGVNPMVTCMALASRTAARIADQR
ncbi:MAG: GMC family oxidoreductase [Polyangiales bacterium]